MAGTRVLPLPCALVFVVTGKSRGSWGFAELDGSNTLVLNTACESANTPA